MLLAKCFSHSVLMISQWRFLNNGRRIPEYRYPPTGRMLFHSIEFAVLCLAEEGAKCGWFEQLGTERRSGWKCCGLC
jgi:hypothetical protein